MTRLVSELTGANLALWVARIENLVIDGVRAGQVIIGVTPNRYGFSPQDRWDHGGPLIEKYEIGIGILQTIAPKDETEQVKWQASGWHARVLAGDNGGPKMQGKTPLIAAMRALVATVYGETVPDEVSP